jgi:hypothetical protein
MGTMSLEHKLRNRRESHKQYKITTKENKIDVRDERLMLGCLDCNNIDRRVLQFDHVRGIKLFNINRGVNDRNISLKKFLVEIDKCEVVCANCHSIRAWERSHGLL